MTTNTSSALLALADEMHEFVAAAPHDFSTRACDLLQRSEAHLRSAATAEPVAWRETVDTLLVRTDPMPFMRLMEECGFDSSEPHPGQFANFGWSTFRKKLAERLASPSVSGEPQPVVAGEREEWVVRKRGYFYRPNAQGYTSSVLEAGRWDENGAKAFTVDTEGVTAHRATEFALPLRTRQQGPDEIAIRAALRPFADHADRYEKGAPDTPDAFWVYVELGQCREARRALAHQPAAPAPASDGEAG